MWTNIFVSLSGPHGRGLGEKKSADISRMPMHTEPEIPSTYNPCGQFGALSVTVLPAR